MDFKGSSAHAAQHQHGVVPPKEPPMPQTVEQRVAKLEMAVERLQGLIEGLMRRFEAAFQQRGQATDRTKKASD